MTEKELYAIILALKHFKHIIYLSSIDVFTDHTNLLYDVDLSSSRAQRWKLLLEEFEVTLFYKKGVKNIAADNLSRWFAVNSGNKTCLNRNYSQKGSRTKLNDRQARELLESIHIKLNYPRVKVLYETVRKLWDIPKIKSKIYQIRTNCQVCQEKITTTQKYATPNSQIST